jgi:hypothetical protein
VDNPLYILGYAFDDMFNFQIHPESDAPRVSAKFSDAAERNTPILLSAFGRVETFITIKNGGPRITHEPPKHRFIMPSLLRTLTDG